MRGIVAIAVKIRRPLALATALALAVTVLRFAALNAIAEDDDFVGDSFISEDAPAIPDEIEIPEIQEEPEIPEIPEQPEQPEQPEEQHEKKEQGGFMFSVPEPEDVRYNDGGNVFINPALGGEGTGGTVYSVVSGGEAADIDAETGELRILAAGDVTVGAYRAGDDDYLPAYAQYTLTIIRAQQLLVFDSPGGNAAYYGTGFFNTALGDGDGAVTYSVTRGGDIAAVDAATGELSFVSGSVGEIEITASISRDGRYFEAEASYTLTVSYLPPPEAPYTLAGEQNNESGWYSGPVTVTPADGYAVSLSNDLTDNVWAESLTVDADATDGLGIYLRRLPEYPGGPSGGITDIIAIAPGEIKIDVTPPGALYIEYDEYGTWRGDLMGSAMLGFFSRSVTVTLGASDFTSGVARFEWMYERQPGASEHNAASASGEISPLDGESFGETGDGRARATFTLPAYELEQCRGSIAFTVSDAAGNVSRYEDGRVIVVDGIGPRVGISFDRQPAALVTDDGAAEDAHIPDARTRFVYNGAATAVVTVREENFFPEIMDIAVSRDGGETYGVSGVNWISGADAWTAEIRLEEDGDYALRVRCSDMSGNPMDWSSAEYAEKRGEYEYISNTISVDTAPPEIAVRARDGDPASDPANNGVYNAAHTYEITVTDRNFRPDGFDITVFAGDIRGVPVRGFDAEELRELKKQWAQWTERSPGVWSTTVVFAADARYVFSVVCADIAGNVSESTEELCFTVDAAPPDWGAAPVAYSEPEGVAVEGEITFYYYNSRVIVSLCASDEVSGIERFNWTYTRERGASSVNAASASGAAEGAEITYEDGGAAAMASFELPGAQRIHSDQYRGGISFTATDRAGNVSAVYDDAPNSVIVVDGAAPLVVAAYAEPRQAVDAATLAASRGYGGGGHILYYDAAAYLTLSVTEPNFYAEDAEILINGAPAPRKPVWRASGDTHTARIVFEADGEYVAELRYADRSKNAGAAFASERIVIDTAPPVIEVRLRPEGRAYEDGGRLYYGEPAAAEITVTEQNFRASDIIAAIEAANSGGNAAGGELIASIAEHLTESGSWTRRGDRATAIIEFVQDANYSLRIGFADLALHGAQSEEARFTVDTSPPTVPVVTYGESLNAAAPGIGGFGYYNAPARVSVSVDDATSGISRIVYRYTDADGAARRGDIELGRSDIAYSNGGRTASVSFYAPASGTVGGQFDGTVEVMAFDRSGNGAGREGDRRVIVDSIAPELTASYSAPVSSRDGISYYAGDIAVLLRVRERNFEPGDVAVSVSRDGRESGVAPLWRGANGEYAGEFALSGEGTYSVSVRYVDKSNNAMDTYTSNSFVIDTAAPVLSLSGVRDGMAYKGGSVGFTLTASDANMDTGSVAARLRAVKRAADGSFEQMDMPLEGPVFAQGVYVYTAPNLEGDGIYTLTVEALDMSGNSAPGISEATGAGGSREIVFSVNRSGAAFTPDS
ncbi:MAG: hypothetical protein LBJ84_03005, partial [Oscillospiraceae bacterium]|nr:hypothetical protein [Oscillospiraceae bacterium]